MIDVEGLVKSFGWREPVSALENVSFQVDTGVVHGLLGSKGAGKTTILRILATTLRPDGGSAKVGGFDVVADARKARPVLGFMPDVTDFRLWEDGLDYLRFWARVSGLPGRKARGRIEEVTNFLAISDDLSGNPAGYTKGQQKKLALAQALLSDPKVLLLDEPLTGVAGEDREGLLGVMRELSRQGATILLTSPLLKDAAAACDRISVIVEGRAMPGLETKTLLTRVGQGRHARIFVKVDGGVSATSALKDIDGVIEVEEAPTVTVAYVDPGKIDAQRLKEALTERGLQVSQTKEAEMTLGDVFRAIVGSED
ncbi:MAG: ATP-binding cassette domain-containing protein [Thermoplasmata archaeon]